MNTRIFLAVGGLVGCLVSASMAQAPAEPGSESWLKDIPAPPKVDDQGQKGVALVTSGDVLPAAPERPTAGIPQTAPVTGQQASLPAAKPSTVDSPAVATNVAPPLAKPPVEATEARFDESAYPEVVCRDSRGVYTATNIPPGWRLVALKQLRFEPAPSVTLANGAIYKIESSPYVLIPASERATQAINPQALQVLYNFSRAEADLLAQLNESLRPRETTPIPN